MIFDRVADLDGLAIGGPASARDAPYLAMRSGRSWTPCGRCGDNRMAPTSAKKGFPLGRDRWRVR